MLSICKRKPCFIYRTRARRNRTVYYRTRYKTWYRGGVKYNKRLLLFFYYFLVVKHLINLQSLVRATRRSDKTNNIRPEVKRNPYRGSKRLFRSLTITTCLSDVRSVVAFRRRRVFYL